MADTVRSARIEAAGDGRFTVSGALTFLTARRSCETGIAAFSSGGRDIVVDCAGVAESDSAGVAVLIEWRRWARAQGRALSFANLPATLRGIAALSGLEAVLEDAPA